MLKSGWTMCRMGDASCASRWESVIRLPPLSTIHAKVRALVNGPIIGSRLRSALSITKGSPAGTAWGSAGSGTDTSSMNGISWP